MGVTVQKACFRLQGSGESGLKKVAQEPCGGHKVGRMYPGFFPSFNFVIGWERENCKKISKRMHVFIREPRNDRKI